MERVRYKHKSNKKYTKQNSRRGMRLSCLKNKSNLTLSITQTFLGVLLYLFISTNILFANTTFNYSDDEIANAIYWAEGGEKTNYIFGIKSIKCRGYNECRRICKNTIRNNRRRYKEYGHKEFKDYLSFLASRYCPTTGKNLSGSERKLNKYWIKNVKYFLKNPKEITNE